MSISSSGLHFRALIPLVTLAILILLYFFSEFFIVLNNTDGLATEQVNNAPVIGKDGFERSTLKHYALDMEEIGKAPEKFRHIPKFERGVDNVVNKTESGFKVEDDINHQNKPESQSSLYVNKKLHFNATDYVKNKTILWWNPPEWMKGFANFDMDQCYSKNCKVTFTQRYFGDSDAVVYSIVDSGMGYKPPVPANLRNPNQAWIFFTLESPIHVNMKRREFMNPDWQGVFNWSWTYRPDADIFHPYETLVSKYIIPKRNYSEIFRKKTKVAAWVVSHCKTHSEREKFVNLLKRYLKVDIFGACGAKPPSDLKKFISENYKFYLGFENSLCDDYVTEKFFYYYQMDVINTVRGKFDYNRHLPKGSFVNTADFHSVKMLAKFMQRLGSNEDEYTKYLKIKDQYTVHDFMYNDALCSVCEKLNNLDMYRKTYENVSDWLGSCYRAKDLQGF